MGKHLELKDTSSFFYSSLTLQNEFQSLEDIISWFDQKKKEERFVVNEIPFSKLEQWYFTDERKSLVHKSGKFFRIEGIHVRTNFGKVNEWEQPIINQPEIGILGILTKVIHGVRYFLMQAKMEPGNINVLQLSPTVQATKSNFSRVHQGKLPAYLEYFIDPTKSTVLIDQLQTEQGGRFFKKRNRNIVVEVTPEIELLPDFRWLTLGEIKKLLLMDNFVNMDARSVISTIPLVDDSVISTLQNKTLNGTINIADIQLSGFGLDLLASVCANGSGYKTKDEIISWYTGQKVNYELVTEVIPLSKLSTWSITNQNIYKSDRFFSVIAVQVIARTREVSAWTQPLIKDLNIGLLGIILKKINGIIHFLIQAKVEPGNLDIIELSPTVSCSNFDHVKTNQDMKPSFIDYFDGTRKVELLFDVLLSEEGGRFYHQQNKNMMVVVDEHEQLEIPSNYTWMTLNQIMDFMKYGMFNIEARSLISIIYFNMKSL